MAFQSQPPSPFTPSSAPSSAASSPLPYPSSAGLGRAQLGEGGLTGSGEVVLGMEALAVGSQPDRGMSEEEKEKFVVNVMQELQKRRMVMEAIEWYTPHFAPSLVLSLVSVWNMLFRECCVRACLMSRSCECARDHLTRITALQQRPGVFAIGRLEMSGDVFSSGWWSALTRLCLQLFRLRANYRVGTNGFTSKRDVFNHFMRVCKNKGVEPKISHTFFGKIVKRYLPSRGFQCMASTDQQPITRAFPNIKYNRKGPRGATQQCYTFLQRMTTGAVAALANAHR
jgi:hypothetical protein